MQAAVVVETEAWVQQEGVGMAVEVMEEAVWGVAAAAGAKEEVVVAMAAVAKVADTQVEA